MKDFTTQYSQIKRTQPRGLRSYAREFALHGLSLKTKLPSAKQLFEKPRVQFLYIHHIFEDEIEGFDKLIKELLKHHTFIGYTDAVNKVLSDDIDKPYICISSDDGFKNNLAAVKILDKYEIKGCFFVNPDTIELTDFTKIQSFCKQRLSFPPTEFMDWNDVGNLMKNGHEIGSHTIGHINVAETNMSEVEDNINESYRILAQRCGHVSHFAYPYGRYFHFNQAAYELVFKAGFTSCSSAERGCHISPGRALQRNELFIRRDHVICDWDINHVLYFILNNSKNASTDTNLNPYR